MRNKRLVATLVGLLVTAVAAAHEGHHHTAMGTLEAIDEARVTLSLSGDKSETFELTEETNFTRSDEEVSREEAVVGERAVVLFETKGERNFAIEVKLPPKTE